MRVFAYCAASFKEATRRAAGMEPLTCPPASAKHFGPGWLEYRDFIYFDLHGAPGEAYWLGDEGIIALRADQILKCNLAGAIVFATNCYLADENSPMMDALLEAGAQYVIGGDGKNWGSERKLYNASLLGGWVRRLIALDVHPLGALAAAKRRLQLQLAASKILRRQDLEEAARDTLAFRAYYRRNSDE